MHALHTVHALPDFRVLAGRLWDGVSRLHSLKCRSVCRKVVWVRIPLVTNKSQIGENGLRLNVRLIRSEPLPIFKGRDKRFDHFGIDVVAVKLIQLRQPKIVACVVGVLWVVRIAT